MALQAAPWANSSQVQSMRVGQNSTKGAIRVSPRTPLDELARIMVERTIRVTVVPKLPPHAPVAVDIVTTRDILGAQHRCAVWLSILHAEHPMMRNPPVLNQGRPAESALAILRVHRIRNAPAINASHMVSGLTSLDDGHAQSPDVQSDHAGRVFPQTQRVHG